MNEATGNILQSIAIKPAMMYELVDGIILDKNGIFLKKVKSRAHIGVL